MRILLPALLLALAMACDTGSSSYDDDDDYYEPPEDECIPSSSTETCHSVDECCSGLCLDLTYECHDWCNTDSDCVSNCCVPLQGGGGACSYPEHCE